jgi:hypothetical protein
MKGAVIHDETTTVRPPCSSDSALVPICFPLYARGLLFDTWRIAHYRSTVGEGIQESLANASVSVLVFADARLVTKGALKPSRVAMRGSDAWRCPMRSD